MALEEEEEGLGSCGFDAGGALVEDDMVDTRGGDGAVRRSVGV